jgi:hypothetical protein
MLQLPHDPVPLHSVATEVVAQWPPGTFLENLALDSDGESWLVTSPFNQTIYRARADGTTQAATKFDQWVTGIVSHPQGPLAAVGTQGQGDWRLHRITDVAAQAVCELPGVLFANGMTWADGRLLVVDSLRSVVLAVDIRAGASSVWLDQTVGDSGREVMAHAGDSDMAGSSDGRRGGSPTAGVHDAVAVAVNHQRGHGDSTQLGGAVARLVDGVDLPCDTVSGIFA